MSTTSNGFSVEKCRERDGGWAEHQWKGRVKVIGGPTSDSNEYMVLHGDRLVMVRAYRLHNLPTPERERESVGRVAVYIPPEKRRKLNAGKGVMLLARPENGQRFTERAVEGTERHVLDLTGGEGEGDEVWTCACCGFWEDSKDECFEHAGMLYHGQCFQAMNAHADRREDGTRKALGMPERSTETTEAAAERVVGERDKWRARCKNLEHRECTIPAPSGVLRCKGGNAVYVAISKASLEDPGWFPEDVTLDTDPPTLDEDEILCCLTPATPSEGEPTDSQRFNDHLVEANKKVSEWPEWKRNVLGSAGLRKDAEQPSPERGGRYGEGFVKAATVIEPKGDGANGVLGVVAHCRCGYSFADDVTAGLSGPLRERAGDPMMKVLQDVYDEGYRQGQKNPTPPTPEGCGECSCEHGQTCAMQGCASSRVVDRIRALFELPSPGRSVVDVAREMKADRDSLRDARDRLQGEVERLQAALATPEVYAGVVSSAVEKDRDEVFRENKALRQQAEQAEQRAERAKAVLDEPNRTPESKVHVAWMHLNDTPPTPPGLSEGQGGMAPPRCPKCGTDIGPALAAARSKAREQKGGGDAEAK